MAALLVLAGTWGRKPPGAVFALVAVFLAGAVLAAVMITCNGIVGVCLLAGSLRHRVAVFNSEGTGAAFATVATLATLTLVLPRFTASSPGPQFSPGQLAFAAVASLVLCGVSCSPRRSATVTTSSRSTGSG